MPPRVVRRAEYEHLYWDGVRSLIIETLGEFAFQDWALSYISSMTNNNPRRCYEIAGGMMAAALLRLLKIHPASEDYDVAGAYWQLEGLATVQGVDFPGRQFLRTLHACLRSAVAPTPWYAALGEEPFVQRDPVQAEVSSDHHEDAPYRRIRVDEPG